MKKYCKVVAITIVGLAISVFLPAGFSQFEAVKTNVGYANSFTMEQNAGTSGGTVKRQIDISSPWSGAYIYEDATIVGRIEIYDSFRMSNVGPGTKDFFGDDIFNDGADSNPGSGAEGNPVTKAGNNNKSDEKVNTGSVVNRNSNPEVEEILGISIVANPTWLDLF